MCGSDARTSFPPTLLPPLTLNHSPTLPQGRPPDPRPGHVLPHLDEAAPRQPQAVPGRLQDGGQCEACGEYERGEACGEYERGEACGEYE